MTAMTALRRDPGTGRFVPSRVVAGGLVWHADEDDTEFGAWVGWQLAVEHGTSTTRRVDFTKSSTATSAETEATTR